MITRGRALDQGEAKHCRAVGDEGDLKPELKRVQSDVPCFVSVSMQPGRAQAGFFS